MTQMNRGQGVFNELERGDCGGYVPEDLVLGARREEIAWVNSEGVHDFVPMRWCTDAGKKLLDLILAETDKTVGPAQFDRHFAPQNTRQKTGIIPTSPTRVTVVLCNAAF